MIQIQIQKTKMKKITTIIATIAIFSATYTFGFTVNKTENQTQIIADSVDLAEYIGTFKMAEGSPVETIIFAVKEGKLTAQAGEYPEAKLTSKVKDVYDEAEMGVVFTFIRIENKINKLKVEVQGMVMEGIKLEAEKK